MIFVVENKNEGVCSTALKLYVSEIHYHPSNTKRCIDKINLFRSTLTRR